MPRPDRGNDRFDDDGRAPDAPPDPSLWRTYSPHLELPTAMLVSVFLHALVVAGLILILVIAMQGPSMKSVPISLVDGGFDDAGAGSEGSGGTPEPLAKGESKPTVTDAQSLPLPKDLPEVKQQISDALQVDDPTAVTPLSDEKASAYAALDQSMRNKLLGLGQAKGAGNGPGSGDSGQQGAGPGGTGADSTRARSLRWILRFKTTTGRDYLDQLKSLGAVVCVPLPGGKQAYIFRDLDNPQPGQVVTEPEWKELASQIQFSDSKRESVVQVSGALKMDFVPTAFWAFFPKGIETELSRLETSYRNKRAEDIEETVFQVSIRGGRYQLVVAEQRMKR